jgi:cytochrome c oxidase subunit 2
MREALSWLISPGSSTYAGEIDWLYNLILIVTGIAFVLVEAALIYFVIKYRERPGRKALYTHGSTTPEYIWTGVTAVVVVIIGLLSAPTWGRIKGRNAAPPGSIPISILGKQFEWHFTYPGADGQLGTADDFSVRNQLHVPVDSAVVATLEAEDVIHSFFVPPWRIKQDAVPGMKIPVWFQATRTGTFEMGCAELCGLGHYRMKARVTVHSKEDFARWMASGGQTTAAAPTPATTATTAARSP